MCTDANDPETAERDADLKIRAYEAGKALAEAAGAAGRGLAAARRDLCAPRDG